ncbi:MAG: DUF4124 domain-containing protein [Xanthomonadales bacterium]|nr:DUF4124 domain-containing protein [Gammaproteobacteria bacterium]MBT8074276.1 DUF4124 domain-containing protein [Gammaproteobacteria bacterium]NNK05128.1 DUF4124 domain-containing protein [Xanthomonadales bacterium]NNK98274.1 DUF4124 domain-containing protein [Xanthomonadales bacterium]
MRIAAIWMVLVLGTGPYVVDNALAGGEVYRWVDENGVVHFGDQPDAKAKANAEVVQIQTTPAGSAETPTADTPAAENASDSAQPSYVQTLREERAARRREAAEREKAIAGDCKRSREVVSQLEPSPRVIVRREDGTVTRLDDNERVKALDEARNFIADNCEK